MVDAIQRTESSGATFYNRPSSRFSLDTEPSLVPIKADYFSGLVSISFSAFDPFCPPPEQSDPLEGPCYSYVGLQDITQSDGRSLKTIDNLHDQLISCLLYTSPSPRD